MGVTNCERHGQGPFVEVCEHVRAQIEGAETPVGYRIDAVARLMVCAHCFSAGGFDEIAKRPGRPDKLQEFDEWALEMMDAVEAPYATLRNRTGYCLRCFEELCPKDLCDESR